MIPLEVRAQIVRLRAERDLLLSAISKEDYDKIEAQLVKIAETSDEDICN